MNKVRVYNHNEFVKEINSDTNSIAKEIASQSPFAELKITDEYDNLILTTKGFFLDDVPNQIWLKNELMPALSNLQI